MSVLVNTWLTGMVWEATPQVMVGATSVAEIMTVRAAHSKPGWFTSVTMIFMALASAIGGAAAYAIAAVLGRFVSGVSGSLVQIAVAGVAGLSVAFAVGSLLRVREVRMATNALVRLVSRRSS